MKQQSPFSRYYKTILKDSDQYVQNQQEAHLQLYQSVTNKDWFKNNENREDNRIDRQTFEKRNSKIKVFGINIKKQIKQDSSPLLILEEEQQEYKHESFSSDPILLDKTELINDNKAETNSFRQRQYENNVESHEQLRRLLENSLSLINLNQDYKSEELVNKNNFEAQQQSLQYIQQIYNVSQVLNQSQLLASEENKGINSIISTLQQLEHPIDKSKTQGQNTNSNLQPYINNKPCFFKQQKSNQNIEKEQIKHQKQFRDISTCIKLQKKDQSIQTSLIIHEQNQNIKQIETKLNTHNYCIQSFPKIKGSKSTSSIVQAQKLSLDNYENKIANLINRYQRASKLKYKDHQIQKQFNIYTQRQNQSIDKKQLSSPQGYHSEEQKLYKQINQPDMISDKACKNNCQQQLSEKIILMDNMINKFKQISQKMTTDYDQDNIQSRKKEDFYPHSYNKYIQKNRQKQMVSDIQKNTESNYIQEGLKVQQIFLSQGQSQHHLIRENNKHEFGRQMKDQKESTLKSRPISLKNKDFSAQQKKQLGPEANKHLEQQKNTKQNPLFLCYQEQSNQQKNTKNHKISTVKQEKRHLNSIKSYDSIKKSKLSKDIEINQNDWQDYKSINLVPKEKCQTTQCKRIKIETNIILNRQNKISTSTTNQNKNFETYRSENKQEIKKESRVEINNQFSNQIIIKKINQASIIDQYERLKIDFPLFPKYPQKTSTQSELLSIGENMFKSLYNFVVTRHLMKFQKLNGKLLFKIQKANDYIRYFTKNSLNYHLVYYFKQKIYFGEWLDLPKEGYGLKHGFGYYHNLNKYKYKGQFYLDCKHGKGTIQYLNGDIYHGKWINRKKQGEGLLINLSGEIFKGNFIAGKKNNRGQEYLKNGDYYRGQYYMGKFEGTGIYKWANGSSYHGQFKNGLLHGKGVWKSPQNDSYEGQYQYNKKHGYGIYKWNNGMIFEGFFADDEKVIKKSASNSSVSKQNTQRTLIISRNNKEKVFNKCKQPKDKPKFKITY